LVGCPFGTIWRLRAVLSGLLGLSIAYIRYAAVSFLKEWLICAHGNTARATGTEYIYFARAL
jgi:hypothetical protein|tara:strand:+ start:96 stop:281 length:186 start_codon:yes stop_codon:yes gene_type:complete